MKNVLLTVALVSAASAFAGKTPTTSPMSSPKKSLVKKASPKTAKPMYLSIFEEPTSPERKKEQREKAIAKKFRARRNLEETMLRKKDAQ